MIKNEVRAVLHLGDSLEQRVIGQRHALDAIAKRVRTSRAQLDNPSRPVGLAFAKIADDDPHDAHLYAMWVAPEARGTGAAAALVDAVVAWTTAQGARTLHTNVTTGNEPAARLYARAGFRDTGRREPLGHSGAETAVLERALAP